MSLPFFFTRPELFDETPAIVQTVNREDVLWGRPVFRAPPLQIEPPALNPMIFDVLPAPVAAFTAH